MVDAAAVVVVVEVALQASKVNIVGPLGRSFSRGCCEVGWLVWFSEPTQAKDKHFLSYFIRIAPRRVCSNLISIFDLLLRGAHCVGKVRWLLQAGV